MKGFALTALALTLAASTPALAGSSDTDTNCAAKQANLAKTQPGSVNSQCLHPATQANTETSVTVGNAGKTASLAEQTTEETPEQNTTAAKPSEMNSAGTNATINK